MKNIIFLLSFLGMFISCGVVPRGTAPAPERTVESPRTQPTPSLSTPTRITDVERGLQSAYEEWKGTPYILGGSGIGGVDCSSFMQIVFRDQFGVTLPRNTREQLRAGSSVRRNAIRSGDLIFFQTSRNVLHVGVAMRDGDFIHASTSAGVMISNLDENYWNSRYLGTRRIL